MRTSWLRWICLLFVVTAAASAEDDRPMRWVKDKKLQKQIHRAIDRGVRHLISKQNKAGHWPYSDARRPQAPAGRPVDRFTDSKKRRAYVARGESATAHDGGLTAAVLYAMGASGIKRDHPSVVSALAWLDRHPRFFADRSPVGTYAASLYVLALTRLDAKHFAPKIRALADGIAAGQRTNGMWGYRIDKPKNKAFAQPNSAGRTDGSNTQLAVLALWAAHSLAGWDGPKAVWQRIEGHYRSTQMRNGTWGYRPGGSIRPDTMTAAGVACYVYARAALDGSDQALQNARASATAKRGLAAHQRFMRRANWHDYYLVYSIERVGTVLGLSDLGWYELGARVLVKRQNKRGDWVGRSIGADRGHAYETTLAILFLSRATLPPKKGAVTPPDRPRTITKTEQNPTLAKAKTHTRAFEIYLALRPDRQSTELRTIGARGPGMIEHVIGVLERDGRKKARSTALDLLQRLLDKRFLYPADAPADERRVMASAIRAIWERMRGAVTWDPKAGRYADR